MRRWLKRAILLSSLGALAALDGCAPGGAFTFPDDPMVGKPAPPFTFHSVHKRGFPSTNFLGKTLVLVFFRPGQPDLEVLLRELEAMHQDPVFSTVQFVAMGPEDDPLTEPFWVGLRNDLPIVLDFNGVASRFGAGSLPMVVVSDYKGTVRLRLDGYLGAEFLPRFEATRKLIRQVEKERTQPKGAS
ncbi:MAG: hypothetical protein DMH00_08120 [Acidobacteria bacterium]|nr:MAG: hypothetical protein DMH00_08120 [Acidobacteriota bacterium]